MIIHLIVKKVIITKRDNSKNELLHINYKVANHAFDEIYKFIPIGHNYEYTRKNELVRFTYLSDGYSRSFIYLKSIGTSLK